MKTLFLTLILASTFAFGMCKKDDSNNITPDEMVANLHWLGQSDFRIETGGKVIYIDHVKTDSAKMADIVLITHAHDDHFNSAAIKKIANANTIVIGPANCKFTGTCKEFKTLLPGKDTTIGSIKIKAVPAYNVVKTGFHPKSNNWVGYIITSEEVSVYHAGDTERIPEMKTFTADIAILPLDQTYTMNSVDEAVEAIKDINPKIAIPMHYGLYEGKVEDATTFKTKLDGLYKVVILNKEK